MKILVDENYDGMRIDKFLRKRFKNIPLSKIYSLIRKKDIKINSKKITSSARISTGDVISCYIFENDLNVEKEEYIILTNDQKEKLKKMIIYEDLNILIVSKPSLMVVHKGSKHDYGLVEMLKSYFENNNITFINRIDKSTSGLIIAAKNLKYVRILNELMRNNEIKKSYYAICVGKFTQKNFIYKLPISRTESIMVYDKNSSKISETHFEILATNGKYNLIKANLITGMHHQLRVQLKHMKCPILGDYKYGIKRGKRMFLCSYKLTIEKFNIKIELKDTKEKYLDKINDIN